MVKNRIMPQKKRNAVNQIHPPSYSFPPILPKKKKKLEPQKKGRYHISFAPFPPHPNHKRKNNIPESSIRPIFYIIINNN